MPINCPTTKISQPRIFFSVCCLFSVLIILVMICFFYYPDDLGLSSGTINFEQQPRRPGLREFHGAPSKFNGSINSENGDSDDELLMVVNSDVNYQLKTFDDDDEILHGVNGNTASANSGTKLRHHAHHHGKSLVPLDELEQTSLMSNVVEMRLLHLDLKGAPPRVTYLKEVMKLAKRSGINGLLLEWEDTFPWKDSLINLTMLDNGGYNREEVEDLINYAELVLDFDVIPLVQTFGHVEFVLKTEEFRHLREIDSDPQAFCPSKSGTMVLIREMIDQIIEMHSNSRYVHIGCDEVWNLRVCPLCQAASDFKEEIFLKHVTKVAAYVRHRGRIPIIWDDMLRTVSLQKINAYGLGSLVEPMVWVYAEDVDRFVRWDSWQKYAEIFPTIWGAAAFKGAFGETLSIPPLSRHADNVDRWVSVITKESPKWRQGVGGLVLTGWMRYDHFSVLCEMLPASVPSLIYNGLLVSIPNSSTMLIKNRVFVPKIQQEEEQDQEDLEEDSEQTRKPNNINNSNIGSSSEAPSISSSSSTETVSSISILASHLSKRSAQSYKKKITHPRILMTKDRLSKLISQSTGGSTHTGKELPSTEIYDKADHVTREFCQILRCPTSHQHTRIDTLLKGSDQDLNFATRCNFPGVAFYRALFRLKGLLSDSWEMVEKVERKRGWMTKYNVRHNYSLPLRVDEVVFSEVPRLRRQLEVVVKGIETSLRPIFRQEIILEWIEQNVWEVWKKLVEFEKNGEILKGVNVWGRRPLYSPREMIEDLKLFNVEQEEL